MVERGADLEMSPLKYQFGEFTLDVARGCVFKAEEEVKLRPKVYETLKYLVEHPGPFHFDDGEVVEVRWVDRAALEELMATATFVPDSIAMLLPLLDLS